MSLFFRPGSNAAGDFIPFYWQGDYHLFFLEANRAAEGFPATPWKHVVTRDFVRFDDWGEALAAGAPDQQDWYVFTGSVIERQGTFYSFYTGHNQEFPKQGRPQEVIMRASSPDLRTWTRDRGFALPAPVAQGYEPNDWRDPFVFWNAEAGQYWMLVAARRPNPAPPRRHGLTALLTSEDLSNWELRDPLWAPDEYFTHECPDMFRVGGWWYLVFSEFSDRMATHYRVSAGPRGPWLAAEEDSFDGRAYYAAKTAGDGRSRYLFGWLPDRRDDSDEGGWLWGGNLVVHEIVPHPLGELTVRAPETVLEAFRTPLPVALQPVLGPWQISGDAFVVDSTARFSVATLGEMPEECLIETEANFGHNTQSVGLLLRASEDLTKYYQVRLEPLRRRLVIDRWPRPGDQPFMLERPLDMRLQGRVRLRVIVDGTCLVVYANDDLALSCRIYDHKQGGLAVFVAEGEGAFRDLVVKGR